MSSASREPIESFRKQLLRTYTFISIQFTVTIIIGISALIGISHLAKEHLNQVGPLVTTVNQLLQGVSDSMLLLDEWMLTRPEENKKKRQDLWESVIYPTANQLHLQPGSTQEAKHSLLTNLQYLQTEQWITEDLVHTQGNKQALNLYLLRIKDIEGKIFSVITQIIRFISSKHEKQHPKTDLFLLSQSADVRGFFSISTTNLLQFILTRAEESEKDFRKNFTTAKNSLSILQKSPGFSQEVIDLINTLNALFARYEYQTNKAIQLLVGIWLFITISTRWSHSSKK
uniref:hypothetical protein n=1 Tax=Candidatus Electrothrix sp. TaxID=2170559 RepID=UPI0040576F66